MTRTTAAKHGGTIIKNPTGTWTLRRWADGKQTNRTFRDEIGKPGSGRKLAADFSLKLAVGTGAQDRCVPGLACEFRAPYLYLACRG